MKDYFDFERDFGELIRKEREEAGMPLKTLADVIGVSEMALSRYERGKRELPLDTAEILSNEFGYSVPELLAKYGHYDDYIPAWFNGDVGKWEAYKKLLAEEDQKGDRFIKYLTASGYTITNNKDGFFTVVFPDGKKANATAEELLNIAEKANEHINELLAQLRPKLKKIK